jgi:hydrogenase expression/formation protein HypE
MSSGNAKAAARTQAKEVLLAHGGGGRATRDLIDHEIVARFGDRQGLPDATTLPWTGERVVMTTDSFVVQPAIFPGGDIGSLSIHGTVNDLAVSGARARFVSLALILEEGLPMATLRLVLDSAAAAARACGAEVVCGDTKVVGRGQADGLYINTTGIGVPLAGFELGPQRVRPGDAVLVSGTLADHGMSVLAVRERLPLSMSLASDSAPVLGLVEALLPWAPQVHLMRDPTRGGLAAVLHELGAPSLARGDGFGFRIREATLPLSPATRAVAELTGIDPLHVASEGRVVLVCAAEVAPAILAAWRARSDGKDAAVIGTVTDQVGQVVLDTRVGGERLVDLPMGELLPRIC